MASRRWCQLSTAVVVSAFLPALAFGVGALQDFPASAVIRGEHVWLRAEPAEETEILAYLQRGDEVTITGQEQAADGDAFYPVEVTVTGATGWVRDLFIKPGSIVPLDVPTAEPAEETVERQPRERRNRRERQNPPAEVREAPAPTEEAQVLEPVPVSTSIPAPTATQVPTQVPTAIPTAIPTQIPTAAPTPVATRTPVVASRQGITPEEAAYAYEMSAMVTMMSGSLTRYTNLLNSPQIGASSWEGLLQDEVDIWNQLYDEALAMTAPESMADIHSTYLLALSYQADAGDETMAAIRNRDAGGMERALISMQESNRQIDIARDLLTEFQEDRGIPVP